MSFPVLLRSLAVLALLMLLPCGCGGGREKAERAAAEARAEREREIRQQVAARVGQEVQNQRLRTWRVAGFCGLGAVGLGALLWLHSVRQRPLTLRDANQPGITRALLPGAASLLPERVIQPSPPNTQVRPWPATTGRRIQITGARAHRNRKQHHRHDSPHRR